MAKNDPSGSDDLLAKAMRKVFQESVKAGIIPRKKEIDVARRETQEGFVKFNHDGNDRSTQNGRQKTVFG